MIGHESRSHVKNQEVSFFQPAANSRMTARNEMMARIQQTLIEAEGRVERSVLDIRFLLLLVFGAIAVVNAAPSPR